jgi:hypothetical protein
MKRRTVVTDRVTCAIAGGGLIAVGLAAAAWERGDLHVPAGSTVRLPWLPGVANSAWWPVILAAVAIVVLVTGLLLLASHRPRQTVGTVSLPGSSEAGALGVDVNTAASAAAADLARHPHIVSASGTSSTDRGQRVIELDVKIDSASGGLTCCTDALAKVRVDLAAALDGTPMTSRILLRTTPVRSGTSRVA